MSARRNPSLAGTAGITAEDLAAVDAKRLTIQDLADKLGVTKQAVSKKIRTMRAAAPTGPSIPTIAPISTSTGPTIPPGAIVIDAMEITISANLGILHRAHALLAGSDVLGPSAIKGLSGAIASARAELALLGVLTAPDDAEMPTEFKIRVLSDEEHNEIKRRVELPDDYV